MIELSIEEHSMKKVVCFAVAALLFASTPALADSGEGATKKCDGKTCAKTASSEGCPISKALADLPELTFTVAGKEV